MSGVAVPQGGVEHRAVSFRTVRDGLVVAAREYWTVAGGEVPPAWRERFRSTAE